MESKGKGAKILVVDDEAQIRRLLNVALTAHGYQVEEANCGQDAIARAATAHPDLVVLDLGLPDMEGLEVIKRVREWSQIPILILSVRGREEDKINALDAGADDYITKPFGMGELLARIRVAMRHVAKPEDEPIISVGDLTIDLSKRLVTMKGQEVKLTPIEYDILKTLASYAGRVITHRQLLRLVWGPEYEMETHYLRVYIGQLRRKIEPDPARPKYIVTEPGVGYRLNSPS
ncbi:MAG TPA: response regulator [Firmicutes bacterium]|nr:response regulator [Bacillota bacterium]HHY99176.1 response regulator [Bacillota bacterium]